MKLIDITLIFAAYLAGSVPFAYLVAKAKGIDIRTVGSGNVGATNVGRALGRKWGILVFALDVLKGFAPTAAAGALLRHPAAQTAGGAAFLALPVALTGLAAIAGHNWPIFLGFKGGKGVATSCGVFLAIFPVGLLIALGVWVLTVALTRYVSVGSMIAAVAFAACALLMRPVPFREGKYLTAFATLAAMLTVLRHRSNIVRLLEGTESKVGEGMISRMFLRSIALVGGFLAGAWLGLEESPGNSAWLLTGVIGGCVGRMVGEAIANFGVMKSDDDGSDGTGPRTPGNGGAAKVARAVARPIALTMMVLGVGLLVPPIHFSLSTQVRQAFRQSVGWLPIFDASGNLVVASLVLLAIGWATVYGLKCPKNAIPAGVANIALIALGICLLPVPPYYPLPGQIMGGFCILGGSVNATALWVIRGITQGRQD